MWNFTINRSQCKLCYKLYTDTTSLGNTSDVSTRKLLSFGQQKFKRLYDFSSVSEEERLPICADCTSELNRMCNSIEDITNLKESIQNESDQFVSKVMRAGNSTPRITIKVENGPEWEGFERQCMICVGTYRNENDLHPNGFLIRSEAEKFANICSTYFYLKMFSSGYPTADFFTETSFCPFCDNCYQTIKNISKKLDLIENNLEKQAKSEDDFRLSALRSRKVAREYGFAEQTDTTLCSSNLSNSNSNTDDCHIVALKPAWMKANCERNKAQEQVYTNKKARPKAVPEAARVIVTSPKETEDALIDISPEKHGPSVSNSKKTYAGQIGASTAGKRLSSPTKEFRIKIRKQESFPSISNTDAEDAAAAINLPTLNRSYVQLIPESVPSLNEVVGEITCQNHNCGIVFLDSVIFEQHKKSCNQEGAMVFECEKCSEKFTDADLVKTHVCTNPNSAEVTSSVETPIRASTRVNRGKKRNEAEYEYTPIDKIFCDDMPLRCNICQKVFVSPKSMATHLKRCMANNAVEFQEDFVQTGKRKKNIFGFTCSICKIRFTERSEMRAHLQGHSTAPFRCTVCGIVVTTKQSLKAHTKNVHKVNTW